MRLDPPLTARGALRWNIVREMVRDLAPESVLEIGCGQGAFGARLALVSPSGHLLLSVPAEPTRLGPSDHAVGHYRRYTGEVLEERLQQAGAELASMRHYAWPLGYLLELARDQLVLRGSFPAAGPSEERTAASGRLMQPKSTVMGIVTQIGVAPFAWLQRLSPSRGTGLIALARRA
jgi:hypothetical protein